MLSYTNAILFYTLNNNYFVKPEYPPPSHAEKSNTQPEPLKHSLAFIKQQTQILKCNFRLKVVFSNNDAYS